MEHLRAKYGQDVVAQFESPDNPLDRAAIKVGITFNKQRRIIRTADSHRLVEWCKVTAPQKQDSLVEALFKAYFEEGKDLSQRAELVACADASGLDGAAAGALIDSQEFVREVETKATSWSRRGVSGVPFFLIHPASGSGQPVTFSGAQPSEVIAEALTEQAEA